MIDRHLGRVAFLVAGCFFMENLDGTIVVTAIPSISHAIGASNAATGLIISSYLITLAVLIPLSGWMSARYGARRVFMAAIVTFTLASLGCALSTSLGMLVALRVLQGAGGAMMVPVGRMAVLNEAPKAQIMRLIAYIVWPGLIAPVVAPLLGGVITTYVGWRFLFLINIPLGVIALVATHRLVRGGPAEHVPPLDRLGVVLTCSGLGALTYAAHLVSDHTPNWPAAIAVGVAAVVLLGLSVWHLLRGPHPLLNLRALRIHTFGAAISGSSMFWLVVGAIPFLLPLLFQTAFGWSPIKSGSIVLFLFVGNIAIKPATTWMYNRFGFRTMLLVATACLTATTIALGLLTHATPVVLMAPLVLLSGVARSVGLTGYTTLGLSDIPPEQMRDANVLQSMVQQLFSGLGVAAATLALRAGGALDGLLPGSPGPAAAFRVAFVLLALVALAATADALRLEHTAGHALMRRRIA